MSLEAETDFGLNLLRQQDLTGSFVFSPLSIALALVLVHTGAKGNTQEQIGNAIGKGSAAKEILESYSGIVNLLGSAKEVELLVANRIFVRKDAEIAQAYLKTVQEKFHADALKLDFSDRAGSAQEINKFVNESTKGHIPKVLADSQIDPDAVAYLVNALFFKGDWQKKFSTEPYDSEFHRNGSQMRKVPTLSEWFSKSRRYSQDQDWQMLSIPYKDPSYSFNVFLPKERFGLQKKLAKLDSKSIQKLLGSAKEQLMNVKLPVIHQETELKLVENLKALGVVKAFSDAADLSGISTNLKLSKAIHKAVIDVHQLGTTAAAVTVIEAVPMSGTTEEPVDFIADHPFLYILAKDKHPIFVGIYQ